MEANNLEVYTFGAPPVASKLFVEHYQGRFPHYRIVNSFDFIPRVGSLKKDLCHIGDAITLPSNNNEVHTPSGYIDNLLDAIANGDG